MDLKVSTQNLQVNVSRIHFISQISLVNFAMSLQSSNLVKGTLKFLEITDGTQIHGSEKIRSVHKFKRLYYLSALKKKICM